jgi:hypothetical protein
MSRRPTQDRAPHDNHSTVDSCEAPQGSKTVFVPKSRTALVVVLRLFGAIDSFALVAVFLPHSWMSSAHAFLGLGTLPDAPIVGYLTRSTSALYALHGAMILIVSFDVSRYWRLITFLAVAALVHGAIMLGIGFAVGMPWYWTLVEGPGFAATGAIVLVIQSRAAP